MLVKELEKVSKVKEVRDFLKREDIHIFGGKRFAFEFVKKEWKIPSKTSYKEVKTVDEIVKIVDGFGKDKTAFWKGSSRTDIIWIGVEESSCSWYYEEDEEETYESSKTTVTESAFSECYTTFRSQVRDVYINEPLTVFFVLDDVLHIIHKPYKKVRLTKEEEEIYNYLFNH